MDFPITQNINVPRTSASIYMNSTMQQTMLYSHRKAQAGFAIYLHIHILIS